MNRHTPGGYGGRGGGTHFGLIFNISGMFSTKNCVENGTFPRIFWHASEVPRGWLACGLRHTLCWPGESSGCAPFENRENAAPVVAEALDWCIAGQAAWRDEVSGVYFHYPLLVELDCSAGKNICAAE